MDEIKQQLADLKLNLISGDKNLLKEKIIDHSPCIIVDLESGIIVFASKRVNELFGFVFNELEGKRVSDLIPSDLHARHDAHMANYLKMPKFRNMGEHGMTLKGRRKDGSEMEVRISLEPFFQDSRGFCIGTIIQA